MGYRCLPFFGFNFFRDVGCFMVLFSVARFDVKCYPEDEQAKEVYHF